MKMAEFIALLSIICSIIALVSTFITTNKIVLLLIVIVILLIFIIGKVITNYVKEHSTNAIDCLMYVFSKTKDNYRVINKEMIYTYQDRFHVKLEKKFTLQFKKREDKFIDRYRWSAPEKNIKISYSNPDFSTLDTRELMGYTYFTTGLGKIYMKNDRISFTIYLTGFYDPDMISKPFLSNSVEEKTEYLKLKVIIPEELKPCNAKFKIFSSSDDYKNPINGENGETLEYDYNIHGYVKDVYYPRLGWKYAISWNFGDN